MFRPVLFATAATLGLLIPAPAIAGGASFDRVVGALNPQACGGSGCWTNHLRVTDLNGDGDLDILLANYPDFFNGSGNTQPLVAYDNDGSANFTNVSAAALGNFSGSLRQVAVGDVDGDGAVDIFAPSGAGNAYVLFMNDGNGVFTDEADVRMPAGGYPDGAAARMGDVDNDGDLDIFSADAYAGGGPPFGHLYLNDGLGVFTEAMGAIPGAISGSDIDDMEFFDVDRDFDLDIVVNAHSGGIGALWLNDGSGTFAAGGSLAPPATGNFHYNVTPCDVDGDGDLDLWIDNIGGGFTEQLQINDGSGNFTDETGARVSGNPGADDNGVVCADIDNDGDLDGVVISLGSAERFLENDGTGNFTYVAGVFPTPTDCSLWGEFGDLNGDDRLDFVTGQGECSSSDEVYLANIMVPADTQDPVVIDVETQWDGISDVSSPIRFAVSDRSVTDEGPRLTRAWIVRDPAADAVEFDADFMGGDLFRAVVDHTGNDVIILRACAEDQAGNVGCANDVEFMPGVPGGSDSDSTAGGSGDGTTGGGDTTGGNPTTGGNSTTSGSPTTGASASASASGTSASATAASADGTSGGDTDTDTDGSADGDDSGCGCTQGRPTPGWLLLGLFGFLARRRRA